MSYEGETGTFSDLTDEEYAASMKLWQERHGLSLAGAAKALGIDRMTYYKYVNGKRPLLDKALWLAMRHYDDHPEMAQGLNPVWKRGSRKGA